MNTKRIGLIFEGELKRILNDNGLVVLNLGYNEIGDLVVVNGKTRIIECKTTHHDYYYLSKNKIQSERLSELSKHNISVYYSIKFINKNKSVIKFYYMNNNVLKVFKKDEGYTLTDFLNHVKVE